MTLATRPSRPTTSLGVIFLVLFLDLVGFSIVFPLYEGMLRHYGATPGLLHQAMAWVDGIWPSASANQRATLFGGLLGALYSLLQFVSAPFWGRLSDRVGRRPILLLSVAASCLAYGAWVVAGSFELLLVSRLIAGLMGGSVSAATAAVADISPSPAQRARAMGLVGMAFGLGFILGPVIGGVAYHFSHEQLRALPADGWLRGLGINPFSGTALIAFVLSLGNLAWALVGFRETLPPERRGGVGAGADRTANPLRLFSGGLGHGVVTINLAFTLHTMLFAGMESTLVFLTAEALGFMPENNGWLFAWMGLMSALVQGGLFRRLAPRVGGRPLAMAGFLLLIPGFALIGAVDLVHSRALLYVGISFLAAGTGLVFPALNTLVSLAADDRNQGLALGTFRSAGSLGRAVGPLLAAVIYFAFRPAAPYVVGAIGMLLPLLLIARLRARGPDAAFGR